MRQILKDPILHFALLGVMLFAGFLLLNRDQTGDDEIVITRAQQQQLAAAFTRVWRREPDAGELKGLIDDWVREELANREALAMGLATNDLIIRRRLRQKFESFMDQVAQSVEPTEADLEAWLAANPESYRIEARYSLQHLFFSSDRRADAAADARAALAELTGAAADSTAVPSDTLAIARQFSAARATELSNRLGRQFTAGLAELPPGRWAGPVGSAYGMHLVFLEAVTPARTPTLAEVRGDVLRDWREAQLRSARDALYEDLLERYSVTLEGTPPEPG